MPAYAYRWADGSVSLCSAEDKTEALELLDRISGVSSDALVELDNSILFTLKPDIRRGWVFDEGDPIDADFSNEVQEKLYPRYDKLYWKLMEAAHHGNPEEFSDGQRALLDQALQRDIKEAAEILTLFEERRKIALDAEKRAGTDKS